VLGCINIILTLPFALLSNIPEIEELIKFKMPFYEGWDMIHSDWEPFSDSFENVVTNAGTETQVEYYTSTYYPIALSFIIFALFGLTEDARETYRKGFVYTANIFGWNINSTGNRGNARVSTIAFGDHEIGSEMNFGQRYVVFFVLL
jgi:hypothetical protein